MNHVCHTRKNTLANPYIPTRQTHGVCCSCVGVCCSCVGVCCSCVKSVLELCWSESSHIFQEHVNEGSKVQYLARDISTVCTIKKPNSSVNAYVIAVRCIVLQCVTCVAMCCSALQHVVVFYGCTKQDSTMRILVYMYIHLSLSLSLFSSFSLSLSFLDGTTRFIFVEIRGSFSKRKRLLYKTRVIMHSRLSPSAPSRNPIAV